MMFAIGKSVNKKDFKIVFYKDPTLNFSLFFSFSSLDFQILCQT